MEEDREMSRSHFDRHLNCGELTRSDIETLASDGLRVSIAEANLQGMDLSRLELSGWRFEGCDLTGARFDRATLEEAVFVSCRGAASSFVGADIQEAVIDGGDFHNASFAGTSPAKLKDDDLGVIAGRRDQLEGKIQERYGYEKDRTKKDIDDWYGRRPW
jgi:uncharacterized protein YjbI with pentapeptide repeats